MIDPVAVADQRIGNAAQIEQAIPVGIVARQARDFQSQHDADVAESHFRGHAGESGALRRSGAGQAQVFINDDHLFLGPSQLAGLSTKAYWRAVDSRLFSTCAGLDWRM